MQEEVRADPREAGVVWTNPGVVCLQTGQVDSLEGQIMELTTTLVVMEVSFIS